MKKRLGFLLPALAFLLFLFQTQEYAESEVHTIVSEGVTEIDLWTVFGDDALDIKDAWLLNADTCVILRGLPYDGSGYHDYEIIVLELQNLSILTRTKVPRITLTWYQQGWDDDGFYVRFTSRAAPPSDDDYWGTMTDWREYNNYSYIKAKVAQDGKVDMSDFMDRWYTAMPGGKTAVYTSYDESLWSIDRVTGEEELLLQGIPRVQATPAGDLYLDSFDVMPEYIPFWDELPSDTWDEIEDASLPFLADDITFSVREFSVVMPLDEYRFVYTVGGWEWENGFGIYDLQARTDHRITGRGGFLGARGSTLFGTNLKADANTYETSTYPKTVQKQLSRFADSYMLGDNYCDISPDGKLLAFADNDRATLIPFAGDDRDKPDAVTVTLTDIQTGDIIEVYSIQNPHVYEQTLSFNDETCFMLFCRPKTNLDSPYLYLFNFEKR